MTTPTPHGLVIIGGGPAARSAAVAFREAGGTGSVLLLSADDTAPYDRPPLSKDYLRGETGAASLALSESADYAAQDITLRLGTEVVALDTAGRTVRTADGSTHPYTACVIATGSAPVVLPVPGGDDPRVLRLRSLADGTTLQRAAADASTVVVIGSGFIGCEAAASLAAMGRTVTVISAETAPQNDRLGSDVGAVLAGWLTGAGVSLVGGATVTAITDGRRVELEGRDAVEADLVLTAVGAAPQGAVAAGAGLETEDGRVVVDAHLAASAAGVWAAGDVARAHNATAGRALAVEHWDDAEAMGAIAGANAAGGDAAWDAVPGFWSEIGERFLQYSAWGDGYDTARYVDHGEGSFTVWYGQDGTTVGVLTCGADDDDEKGRELIRAGGAVPE